ncbi:MAG TPA: PaaI family thioesterase [Paraburkholderia sp.]
MEKPVLDNPFLESLSVTLTEWRDGYAEFAMPIKPATLNRQRILQGGAIATLLDAAAGYAGLYSEGQPVHGFTLSLTVHFLDKGLGQQVVSKGFLERRGRAVYFARAEAWVDGRVLIASAQGVFKYA